MPSKHIPDPWEILPRRGALSEQDVPSLEDQCRNYLMFHPCLCFMVLCSIIRADSFKGCGPGLPTISPSRRAQPNSNNEKEYQKTSIVYSAAEKNDFTANLRRARSTPVWPRWMTAQLTILL